MFPLFQFPVGTSNFRSVIEFFGRIGLYDVVLPFILVFTIVFAIFEKTRVLGFEEIDGKKYPKKNLDSMVAFVIAFLVVASTNLVAIVNKTAAQVTLVLLAIVMFLLLIGSFLREGTPVQLWGGWRSTFMILSLIAVALIFLNAIGWLNNIWRFIWTGGSGTEAVGAVVLLIIVISFMAYTVRDVGKSTEGVPGEDHHHESKGHM